MRITVDTNRPYRSVSRTKDSLSVRTDSFSISKKNLIKKPKLENLPHFERTLPSSQFAVARLYIKSRTSVKNTVRIHITYDEEDHHRN